MIDLHIADDVHTLVIDEQSITFTFTECKQVSIHTHNALDKKTTHILTFNDLDRLCILLEKGNGILTTNSNQLVRMIKMPTYGCALYTLSFPLREEDFYQLDACRFDEVELELLITCIKSVIKKIVND